jgi:hypothetical protein
VLFSSGVPSAISIPVILEPGKLAAFGKLAAPVKAGASPNRQPGQVLESPEASFRANLQTIFEAASEDFHAAGLALKDASVALERPEIQRRSSADRTQPLHARPPKRVPGFVHSSQLPAKTLMPVDLLQHIAAKVASPDPSPAPNPHAAPTRRATAERATHFVPGPHRISHLPETRTFRAMPQISPGAVPAPVSQVVAPESRRPETATPGPVRTTGLIEELQAPPLPTPVEGHPSLTAIRAGFASPPSVAEPAEHPLPIPSAGPASTLENKAEPAEHSHLNPAAGQDSVGGNQAQPAEHSRLIQTAAQDSFGGNKAQPVEHSLLNHSAGTDSVGGNQAQPAEHSPRIHSVGPESALENKSESAEHHLFTHSAGTDSVGGNQAQPAEHSPRIHSAGPESTLESKSESAEHHLFTHSAGTDSVRGTRAEAGHDETRPSEPGRVNASGPDLPMEGHSSSAANSPRTASAAVPAAKVGPAHAGSPQPARAPAPIRASTAANEAAPPPAPAHEVVETAATEAKSAQGTSILLQSKPARALPVERAATASSPAALPPAALPVHGAPANLRREFVNPASPAVPAQADTFAALDAAPPAPVATWVHAGANRAEAGYLDPTLGWVAVRAEAPGNLLHASIVPSTPEAAQALGSHLAGLNTYLADHRGAAAQLTIATPESGQASSSLSGFDTSGRQPEQQPGDAHPAVAIVNHPTAPREADPSLASPGAGFETLAPPTWSGGHISVIA